MEFTAEELALIESIPELDGLEEMAHEKTIGSKGKGLWGMKGEQLPAYIQHVYNDLVESGKHKPGSMTYRLAVGIVQRWARGGGGVKPDTKAKAVAAIAEFDKLRAKAKADNVKESESLVGRIAEAWSPQSRLAAAAARRRKGGGGGIFKKQEESLIPKPGTIHMIANGKVHAKMPYDTEDTDKNDYEKLAQHAKSAYAKDPNAFGITHDGDHMYAIEHLSPEERAAADAKRKKR